MASIKIVAYKAFSPLPGMIGLQSGAPILDHTLIDNGTTAQAIQAVANMAGLLPADSPWAIRCIAHGKKPRGFKAALMEPYLLRRDNIPIKIAEKVNEK